MTRTGKVALKIWALVLAFAIGALTVPGCVIQIGPGTTSGDPSDPTGATTGQYWGYGFNLRTRFGKGWNGFVCFPFGK